MVFEANGVSKNALAALPPIFGPIQELVNAIVK